MIQMHYRDTLRQSDILKKLSKPIKNSSAPYKSMVTFSKKKKTYLEFFN